MLIVHLKAELIFFLFLIQVIHQILNVIEFSQFQSNVRSYYYYYRHR